MGKDARHADMACIFLMKLLLIPDSANVKKESNNKRGEKQKV